MDTRVVCISRTLAGGGEAIGHQVSERLGFRYVDEEIVAKAAERADLDPKLIAESEQRRSLIDRLLDAIAQSSPAPDAFGYMAGFPLEIAAAGIPPNESVREDYRAMIRNAVEEVAEKGQVVIVAHAASVALAEMDGVLRVLITASPETRAERLSHFDEMGEKRAAKAIADSDRERSDYFKRFYKIREEQSTHYDLVVNTDRLAAERCADLIVFAAGG